ncbi:hypothetical protein LTR09_002330 [Extremus antarcticus]|uniref:Uncharacterized protein n=1 Tax=Extremus antarcticus TaxID=702011 RepID=A0AAJ0GFH0_9PEZI|nr:hypothetical protein LTR09_002330 [Extremus antarcticus]
MAVDVDASGGASPSQAEDVQLLDELIALKQAVVSGQHAFKLPFDAIERLKASLLVPETLTNGHSSSRPNGLLNGSTHATNETQRSQPASYSASNGLPGLKVAGAPYISDATQVYNAKPSSAAGLDPIFLEKSDSLVRAEGQLKRQRIERELQTQADQPKHNARDKDPGLDALDVDAVLKSAMERVKPVSGLKAVVDADSSFDENDYYSSQVQSDWSSDASSKNGSDRAAGAFTGDFERLDGAPQGSLARPKQVVGMYERGAARSSLNVAHTIADEDDDMYDPEDEDDDYTPPDVPAFGRSQACAVPTTTQQVASPEDDNSDYEPGEITADNSTVTPNYPPPQAAPAPRQVPIIRNHLTHIAAPQPNRVSPLATAKAPSYDLELINGSPQVVLKPKQYPKYVPSRASTGSPSGNGNTGTGKRNKKNKKRKRDHEPMGRAKRRQRQSAAEPMQEPAPEPLADPAQRTHSRHFIKDEPMSPPPFNSLTALPAYARSAAAQRPIEIDLATPRRGPQPQYMLEGPRSGLRYESSQPAGSMVRLASPSYHRPVQRDTQDLRRVASMHHAQRPASPAQPGPYSPVGPYQRRTTSMTYGDLRFAQVVQQAEQPTFVEQPNAAGSGYYPRTERSQSPYRVQEYQDPYAQAARTAAATPAPTEAPRRIIVDQYGNRYMDVGPAPAPAPAPAQTYAPRASVAPVETRAYPEMSFERAPSRMSVAYAPQAPAAPQYPSAYAAMPPPPARRQPEQQFRYVDANGAIVPGPTYRPAPEPQQYASEPTSPVYQQHVRAEPTSPVYQQFRYEQMPPPPPPPARNITTSPAYAPTRSYSVRPEEPQYLPASYARQGSVAPVQYVRQEPAPAQARAASVMPGMDYHSAAQQAPQPAPQRTYSQAPQQSVRYMDQYGNEVFPRQVSEMRY